MKTLKKSRQWWWLGAAWMACQAFPALAQPVVAPGHELSALLAQTLQVHPQLKAQRSFTQSRRFEVEASEAQRYPSLSADVGRVHFTDTDTSGNSGTLRLRQPLWTFGRIDANVALAQNEQGLARVDEWRTARQLLEQAAQGYATVRGLRQQLVVSAENLQNLELLQLKIERRRDGQQASASDVRLMATRLTQAQVQHDRLVLELQRAQEELFTLSQLRIKADAEVPPALWMTPAGDAAALSVRAQAFSPEVRFQRQAAEVARAQLEQVDRSAWPTVYAQVARPVGGAVGNTTVGVFLEARLDGAGAVLRSNTQAAAARLQSAEEELDAAQERLSGNLRVLLLQAEALGRTQARLETALADAQLTYESYVRQFEAGFKAWADVLNMQREMTDQRQALVQNQTQRWSVGLRLAALLGQLDDAAGWQAVQP
ncbi:MAG: TolC family protein [Hydrogenophaga sp.]